MGRFAAADGSAIEADKSLENSPSVLFDALVLPDGAQVIDALAGNGQTLEYIKDQFRHCKTILALGASRQLLEMAGVLDYAQDDAGIIMADSNRIDQSLPDFLAAIAAHRHSARDSDPPKV